MWDLSFMISGTLMLGLLLINFFSQKKLPIRINRSFVVLLVVSFVTIILNLIASWECNYYQFFSSASLYFLNVAFFAAFLFRAYCFYAFTSVIFHVNEKDHPLFTILLACPLILCGLVVLSSPFTKAIFYIDANGYQEGKYFQLTTIVSLFYVALSFIRIVRRGNRLSNRREFYGVILYNLAIVVGLGLRAHMRKLLLMDTFCLMAILIINGIFILTEYYMDRRCGLFNSVGFRKVLNEIDTVKKNQLITFAIINYQEAGDIYGTAQMERGLGLIGNYLNKAFPNCNIFYLRAGRFAIMMSPKEDAKGVMDTLGKRFSKPWIAQDVYISLEIAFAEVDEEYRQYETDMVLYTLYRKLERTQNAMTTRIGNEDFQNTLTEKRHKKALEKAIETRQVEIFIQPIVDSKDYSMIGAESLCRIRDENGDILPPSAFIEIAENNGRIIQLGDLVFEKTCWFISQNDIKAMGLQWININLSTIQFLSNDLADRFEKIIQKYDVDPQFVHLEITETAIHDETLFYNQVEQLREKGFHLCLDDYGSGYSNAARLTHVPFSNIKLDMSLVWEYCKNRNPILPTMIETFKNASYTVTAEGIETIEQAEALRNIACDYLQGYYFSKPMPMEEFVVKYAPTK